MAEYTTGHCPNHNQPGGCQLHNLQCGWPNCDRRQVQPQPPAAASVSERALELLAAELRGIGYPSSAAALAAGANTEDLNVLNAALRALEQALTQQRGEASAASGVPFGHYWVWKDGTAQFLLGQSNWALESACKSVTPLYTTPQPSADAVRELVERWRSNGHPYVSDCADELESLLSGGSHA